MKLFIKNNLLLFGVYFLFLCVALYYILSYDKQIIHLYLNNFVGHKPVDAFFTMVTWLGDGTVAVILLLIILVYNVRLGLYASASFLTASLASFGLKRLFFDDVNRPFFIFNYYTHHKLKLIEGVDVHIHNSFPSGHATQAFAILMCLAFAAEKQYVKLSLLLLALITSYSRVHLSQHWLVDVTAGSAIGLFFSLGHYYLFIAGDKLPRLNKPIFLFIRYWRLR